MSPSDPRPLPPLLLIGTDFRTAPLELREKVAYAQKEAEEVLVHLLARPEVGESLLLSTCNRTEVYLAPRDEETAYQVALERVFLTRTPELQRPGHLYVKRDQEAARHLLAVAAGLESMVLGEPEILGQTRQAASLADAVGATGPVLKRLVTAALATGRRARAETALGSGAVSLGYTVVEIARNIFTDWTATHALVVGAGETARMVVRNLRDKGLARITVANRSRERAEALAAEVPGLALLPFNERGAAVAGADIVVAATGAEEPVLTRRHFEEALGHRSTRKLLVVDLGVPRNIDPRAAELENLFLHTLSSLEQLIERNLRRRRQEVPRVEELLAQELRHLIAGYRGLAAEPLIAQLQKQAERIRRQELVAALERFPPETHGDLERLTRSLVRKILHHPSTTLRGAGQGERSIPHLELVRELFRLDEEGEE
jgi:glutamyl-tRNA reductase